MSLSNADRREYADRIKHSYYYQAYENQALTELIQKLENPHSQLTPEDFQSLDEIKQCFFAEKKSETTQKFAEARRHFDDLPAIAESEPTADSDQPNRDKTTQSQPTVSVEQQLRQNHIKVSIEPAIAETMSENYTSALLKVIEKYQPLIQNTHIRIVEKSMKYPFMMNVFPSWKKVNGQPQYTLYINTANDSLQTLKTFDEEHWMGIFSHEIGHISDYRHMTALQKLGFAIRYGLSYLTKSKKWIKRMEARIDQIAIDQGFGHELHAQRKQSKERYVARAKILKSQAYQSPFDIIGKMLKSGIYSPKILFKQTTKY